MELHGSTRCLEASLKLKYVGINKERNTHAFFPETLTDCIDLFVITDHIEASFCGHLLAFLGDESHLRRGQIKGELNNFFIERHLEVEGHFHELVEETDIFIFNVPAVFS
jgi:hypothetical protein